MQTSKSKISRRFPTDVRIWSASADLRDDLTERKSINSLSPVCADVCERVHAYQTFSSLPGTQRYLHRAASRSVTVASWPMSTGVGLGADCVPAALSTGVRPRLSHTCTTLMPHRTKPLWSLRWGSVMLMQLPSGRDIQLLSLVDLFQIYCMTYLPLVTNTHRSASQHSSPQQSKMLFMTVTVIHFID